MLSGEDTRRKVRTVLGLTALGYWGSPGLFGQLMQQLSAGPVSPCATHDILSPALVILLSLMMILLFLKATSLPALILLLVLKYHIRLPSLTILFKITVCLTQAYPFPAFSP